MSTSNNTTDKKVKKWETLKDNNPWKKIFNEDTQVLLDRLLNEKDVEFICHGDEDIIRNRNKVLEEKEKEDNVFVTSLLPKPYRGNLKDPKLVILSLNPGYKERVKKTLFEMLREEHQKQFIEIAKMNALLEDNCNIIFDDVDIVTDNSYWLDKLSDLISDGADRSKIGLIQFIPYASKHYDSWGDEASLETQKFTKKIIQYLLDETDALFLVMRSREQWEKLIGNEMNNMDNKDRFLYSKNPRCQKISPKNLHEDQYNRIINALK